MELTRIQKEILSSTNYGLVQLEKRLIHEPYDLLHVEESYYKQKSRVQWLKEEDSNIGFFHKNVATRQSRNTISTLIDANRIKILSLSKLASEVGGYF